MNKSYWWTSLETDLGVSFRKTGVYLMSFLCMLVKVFYDVIKTVFMLCMAFYFYKVRNFSLNGVIYFQD